MAGVRPESDLARGSASMKEKESPLNRAFSWSGRRDSNPRPPLWQGTGNGNRRNPKVPAVSVWQTSSSVPHRSSSRKCGWATSMASGGALSLSPASLSRRATDASQSATKSLGPDCPTWCSPATFWRLSICFASATDWKRMSLLFKVLEADARLRCSGCKEARCVVGQGCPLTHSLRSVDSEMEQGVTPYARAGSRSPTTTA